MNSTGPQTGEPGTRPGTGISTFLRIVLLLSCAALASAAWAKQEFLPPEQAYRYSTSIEGDQLIVSWQIEKGYYLYKQKMGVASATPTAQLGPPAWPQGEAHSDEYFGEQEIYRGKMVVAVPIAVPGPRPSQLAVELKLQGCADAGLCYPPLTWKTQVALPPAAATPRASSSPASSSPASSSLAASKPSAGTDLRSFFNSAQKSGKAGNEEFLPPDSAFKFGAGMERADAVALTWIIADGYYLYRDKISITTDSPDVTIGKPSLPQGEPKYDEFFGNTEVYYEVLEASLPVARAADSSGTLTLNVTYQGCADGGLCYNPITKTVAVELPPTSVATTLPAAESPAATNAPVAEQDRLATLIRDGNLAVVLGTFFGLGLLLAFTPCVLPMIPILSGIIVGQGDKVTAARGFSLAFTYVQGMALTYAAAGAIFVLAFQQAPQAFFQQPWIIIVFALLFIALALAMFGSYSLQLPSSLQTRLTNVSNRQKSGTYIGTFIMGALSALIVTACVAPAIIAALSVISQTGQIARGAAALYATGLGMGVPLLIVGASAGSLLPRVGPWMDTMKQLFGVLFLGVAIYVLRPLLPDTLSMLLWSALAVIAGFWVFSLKGRDGTAALAPIRAVGLLALVYGIILLIGVAAGSRDPMQPLGNLRSSVGGLAASAGHPVVFQRIKSVADLERQVAAASAAGKPVMLDFYADWCVSCIEMEKYTFTDPQVQAAWANAVLLQADVTANDAQDQALLAHFGIFGPPTIAFFGSNGVERSNFRLVGFTPANRFREHVIAAFAEM